MNFRKNSTLIIGLGVSAVLLAVAVFFLVKTRSVYSDRNDQFNATMNRLTALNNRNPFPSIENKDATETQRNMIRDRFAEVNAQLRSAQLASEVIEPARFALLLEDAVRSIREKAASAGTTLPAEPGLGFRDYAAGKLPPNDTNIMERLVFQIRALEHLLSLLVDAKVSSIDALQREHFELAPVSAQPEDSGGRGRGVVAVDQGVRPDSRSADGGIPPAPVNPLFATERFTVEFTGRESAVWEALNRLVASPVCYVLVDVKMTSTAANLGKPVDLKSKLSTVAATRTPLVSGPAIASSAAQPGIEALTREERVVGGREPIQVRLVVDMYRFKEAVSGEDAP
jgi:hypothetical protein